MIWFVTLVNVCLLAASIWTWRQSVRAVRANELSRQRTLELNDDIVQGLTVAKMALDLREQDSSDDVQAALATARTVITDLLAQSGQNIINPGDLRRSAPALLDRLTYPRRYDTEGGNHPNETS